MKLPLENKTALITGASRGLGLEIARRFARDGANVVLVARDQQLLESVLPHVRDAAACAKQQFCFCSADLRDQKQIERLSDEVQNGVEAIDILVNNAAIQGPIGRFDDNDWLAWKTVFDVNLFAPARLAQGFIPSMRERGGGKIINISGGGAASARPHFSAYAASKCALVRWTETIAEELKADRIDVNAVAPGAMNTRMLEELIAAGPDAAPREHEAAVERAKSGGAAFERAAALVAWLASPASDGITGKLISAAWDDWERLDQRREDLRTTDLFTLRRVT